MISNNQFTILICFRFASAQVQPNVRSYWTKVNEKEQKFFFFFLQCPCAFVSLLLMFLYFTTRSLPLSCPKCLYLSLSYLSLKISLYFSTGIFSRLKSSWQWQISTVKSNLENDWHFNFAWMKSKMPKGTNMI